MKIAAIIVGIVALAYGLYWCFTSGPCSSGGTNSSPNGATSPIASVQAAVATVANLVTGGDDLSNETNGIIFGGGA